MKKITLCLLSLVVLLASCTSTKKIAYFQGADDRTFEKMAGEYEMKIAPGDNLYITVTPMNAKAESWAAPNATATNVNVESLKIMGYLVDGEGNIEFPTLGKVHLAGMTRNEAVEHLRVGLSKDMVNPVVNVRFLNFKVTVLGEVVRPGTFNITDERITLPEALGMAGDMTIYGKRDNVLVTREVDGMKTFGRLDMTSADVFESEFYYLKQNDVVYVQPNKARAGSSSYNQNLTLGVSVGSLLLTIIALVAN